LQQFGQKLFVGGMQSLRNISLSLHLHAASFSLDRCLQDFQQSAVQRQWALSDAPAANSSTYDLPFNIFPSQQPGWTSNSDLQQQLADEPHSSAATRSARLFSGAETAEFKMALPTASAAQPAVNFISTPTDPDADDSSSNQSTAVQPIPSSSSSSSGVWVDVVDSDGSTVMELQLDPLCSQVLLLEEVQDVIEARTTAALAAERDAAVAAKR
jgi:hypothetical protein